jgi:septal ring factor EnvC (AmiA/AmiB activator)
MTDWTLSATEWAAMQDRHARSDARFDAFLARFDEHVRRTNEHFQRLDTRLDRLEVRGSGVERHVVNTAADITLLRHEVGTGARDLASLRQRAWGFVTAVAALGGTLGFAGSQALHHLMRVS